eukprot:1170021-Amphidinium_carterae.1
MNGSVTVSVVNATHHSKSDSLVVRTQCWSQPKGDVKNQSEDQKCDQESEKGQTEQNCQSMTPYVPTPCLYVCALCGSSQNA